MSKYLFNNVNKSFYKVIFNKLIEIKLKFNIYFNKKANDFIIYINFK